MIRFAACVARRMKTLFTCSPNAHLFRLYEGSCCCARCNLPATLAPSSGLSDWVESSLCFQSCCPEQEGLELSGAGHLVVDVEGAKRPNLSQL